MRSLATDKKYFTNDVLYQLSYCGFRASDTALWPLPQEGLRPQGAPSALASGNHLFPGVCNLNAGASARLITSPPQPRP
jgi:hypothetical protein